LQFDIKLEGIEEALRRVNPQPVLAAARRSLRETASAARSAASNEIRQRYNIAKKHVDKQLSKHIKPSALTADITAKPAERTATLPITLFRVKKPSARKKYIRVQVIRGGPWYELKRAFFARMPSGYTGVFERVGRARYPIREVRTIDVPLMFVQRNVRQRTIAKAVEKWSKDFPQRLDWILKGRQRA